MSVINSYPTFNGNCREAMSFYRQCLGGEVTIQTIGESPLSNQLSPHMKECVLHATLTKEDIVLMGSDMVSDQGLIKGNAVSLCLSCNSEDDIRTYYTKLSEGGQATHPLEHTSFGACLGNLIDKFGNNWMLHYNENAGH